MKKKFVFAGFALLIVVGSVVIVARINNNKQTPLERHIEEINQEQNSENNTLATSPSGEVVQVSGSENSSEFNVMYNNRHTLEYKVISYEVYDDSNILDQSQFLTEYYLDGEYPDPNYIYSGINWHQLRADYPEVAEYLDLDYEDYINSSFDYDGFMEQHSGEYQIEAHPDTRYIFVTIEVTNLTDNTVEDDIPGLLCIQNDNQLYETEVNWTGKENVSYFDWLSEVSGDESYHRRTWYSFEPGESHTFTIGYTVRAWPYMDSPLVFTENDLYYYCIPYADEQVTSPEYFMNSVCLNELS